MDLKLYFQKIRDVEANIEGDYTVVVSLDTPEGGRAGTMTEVSKKVAAKLVVDAKARLGAPDEIRDFYAAMLRGREDAIQREMESRGLWPQASSHSQADPKSKRRQPKNKDE